jgi:hypothetical protein
MPPACLAGGVTIAVNTHLRLLVRFPNHPERKSTENTYEDNF